MQHIAPDLDDIARVRETLAGDIVHTPLARCAGLEDLLANNTEVHGKLEFLQRTGTFKARGALATLRALSAEQRAAGVTAVSAGNHAVATAFAASVAGTHARVVMTAAANPARIEACRAWGADIVFADNVHVAFEVAEEIRATEGRTFVHPFEGPHIACGTGTVGLEICEALDAIDALVVAVGGGGLIGGIANAVKQVDARIEVIGVEPEGADTLHRSFAAGEPVGIDAVGTIADSLGAPFAMPYSYELCRRHVDRLVRVSDQQLRDAMGQLYRHMHIAVEPACAAAAAALLGPLRESLAGARVVLVFCGSIIDWPTFARQADL